MDSMWLNRLGMVTVWLYEPSLVLGFEWFGLHEPVWIGRFEDWFVGLGDLGRLVFEGWLTVVVFVICLYWIETEKKMRLLCITVMLSIRFATFVVFFFASLW